MLLIEIFFILFCFVWIRLQQCHKKERIPKQDEDQGKDPFQVHFFQQLPRANDHG